MKTLMVAMIGVVALGMSATAEYVKQNGYVYWATNGILVKAVASYASPTEDASVDTRICTKALNDTDQSVDTRTHTSAQSNPAIKINTCKIVGTVIMLK